MKKYDETSVTDICRYSEGLKDKTFMNLIDVAEADTDSLVHNTYTNYLESHQNLLNKGSLGEVVEECYFEYKANNSPEPDFPKADLELKVTPFKQNKNGTYSAKERLVICMIDYKTLITEPFYESHFWNKSKLILLIYYRYSSTKCRLDYPIEYMDLFTPPHKDMATIIKDYSLIQYKVKKGLAHELSSSDTLYIEATTKGANSSKLRAQPCSSIKAKPRAFAYKTSYMTMILNDFILRGKPICDSIMSKDSNEDLESFVLKQIDKYKGWSEAELAKQFDVDMSRKPKDLDALLAFRILGVKSNEAEEFKKAGIVVKSVRIENNGTIVQHMSFPYMDYEEVASSTWEDSEYRNYLSETRFLLVVFKFDENQVLRLRGCQFWNIPYTDLEEHVRKVWLKTQKVLNEGLKVKDTVKGKSTNFPKIKEDEVCHVRPHATRTSKPAPLPVPTSQGDIAFRKHCFWLRNIYILKQLRSDLKE